MSHTPTTDRAREALAALADPEPDGFGDRLMWSQFPHAGLTLKDLRELLLGLACPLPCIGVVNDTGWHLDCEARVDAAMTALAGNLPTMYAMHDPVADQTAQDAPETNEEPPALAESADACTEPHVCPECAAGKHRNCSNEAWCMTADCVVDCDCRASMTHSQAEYGSSEVSVS